jgi:hypothetical protein
MDIAILDTEETRNLIGDQVGRPGSVMSALATALLKVIDTDRGVFVKGLNESQINNLRTTMARHNARINVKRTVRDEAVGHLITARSIPS